MISLILLCVLSCIFSTEARYIYADGIFNTCPDKWHITRHDNNQAKTDFQNWLLQYQYDSYICKSNGIVDKIHDYGIGSAVVQGIVLFGKALKEGKIYRPVTEKWLWADTNITSCSLKIPSVDCFFLPLSVCKVDHAEMKLLNKNSTLFLSQRSQSFNNTIRTDVCGLAILFQKPLIWIFGQLVHYFLRPRSDMIVFIEDRIQQATLSALRPSDDVERFNNTSSIGVHIRGRNPDADRKVVGLAHYVRAVDEKAKELELSGRPVRCVYFSSDDMSIIAHLTEEYPRPWKYITLPHLILGDNKVIEQEDALRASKHHWHQISRSTLVGEYIADIEIFAAVDVFIGSFSNVFALVSSLRLSRYSNSMPLNSTCLVDYRHTNFGLFCEGSTRVKEFWASSFLEVGLKVDDDMAHWKE